MNNIKRKLWIDDERLPPEGFDAWCTNAYDAIRFISKFWGQIELISFDHDFGEGNGTGDDVVKFIEEKVFVDHLEPIMEFQIHSQNPVGIKNMAAGINSIRRYVEKFGV
jgi:hypothetical protein